jgi:hypothetical protein
MENENRGEHFSKGDMNAYMPNVFTVTAQIKKNQDTRIHPIFRPDKFPPELDYETAFQEAALLASRLLKSQQSYHWLFALWFGENKQSRVPYDSRNTSSPNVPEEYTTNRGIGELTHDEIDAVDRELIALSRRVRFKVPFRDPDNDSASAPCHPGRAKRGQQSFSSTIWIRRGFYDVMIQSEGHQSPNERAALLFAMATTLLHEMAHAAHFHIMGPHPEDFFEDALVAEAGFNYESQIFGMVALISRADPLGGAWYQWQNLSFLDPTSYPVNELCRDTMKLSMNGISHPFDVEFAKLLLSNEWWEYWGGVEERSTDIVPVFLLRRENAHLLATAPASLQDWVSGAAHHQHEAIETPRLRPRRRVRKSTPPSYSTATTLEFDPEPSFENGILSHTPLPFPKSTEDIRRVVPVHGGIDPVLLKGRFEELTSPGEESRYAAMVGHVCRSDRVSRRLVLRENEERRRIWCRAPFGFPESAEDIRRVIPTHGGIYAVLLRKLFEFLSSPLEERKFFKLVDEVCWFDPVNWRYTLRECEDGADDEMDLC